MLYSDSPIEQDDLGDTLTMSLSDVSAHLLELVFASVTQDLYSNSDQIQIQNGSSNLTKELDEGDGDLILIKSKSNSLPAGVAPPSTLLQDVEKEDESLDRDPKKGAVTKLDPVVVVTKSGTSEKNHRPPPPLEKVKRIYGGSGTHQNANAEKIISQGTIMYSHVAHAIGEKYKYARPRTSTSRERSATRSGLHSAQSVSRNKLPPLSGSGSRAGRTASPAQKEEELRRKKQEEIKERQRKARNIVLPGAAARKAKNEQGKMNHGKVREVALEAQMAMTHLNTQLSADPNSAGPGPALSAAELAKQLEEERKKIRMEEAKSHPMILAREELSQRIRALLETLQSEITARAIRNTNEVLSHLPKDPRSIIRKMLIAKVGTVEGIIKIFDNNGNGDISFSEFHDGIHKILTKPDIEMFKALTGIHQFSSKRLFALFDDDASGSVDTVYRQIEL